MYTLYTMNDKKQVVIHSRIDHETMEKLQKIAKVKKWDISATIRNILEDYLE